MGILFTNAGGKCLQWDVMLWSSPAVPGAAGLLNQEPLGWGRQPGSILSRARQQAEEYLGPVELKQLDLTGMPEEDNEADVIFGEEALGEADKSLTHKSSCFQSAPPVFGVPCFWCRRAIKTGHCAIKTGQVVRAKLE